MHQLLVEHAGSFQLATSLVVRVQGLGLPCQDSCCLLWCPLCHSAFTTNDSSWCLDHRLSGTPESHFQPNSKLKLLVICMQKQQLTSSQMPTRRHPIAYMYNTPLLSQCKETACTCNHQALESVCWEGQGVIFFIYVDVDTNCSNGFLKVAGSVKSQRSTRISTLREPDRKRLRTNLSRQCSG